MAAKRISKMDDIQSSHLTSLISHSGKKKCKHNEPSKLVMKKSKKKSMVSKNVIDHDI